MKIIISHDVDHLYGRDHWFRDLIYPKLWVRSGLEAISGKITWREFLLRSVSCFKKERHHLREVMAFDRMHGVPSSFFFGMNQGLGMSYYPQEAASIIKEVRKEGFDVGVHGIEYQESVGIKKEFDTFVNTAGFIPNGIRMHYVRFDDKTFQREAETGYRFDSTEFDKEKGGTIKAPYRVGSMWEFPLSIMDVYLPQNLAGAKSETLRRLEECRTAGLEYVCVLFHEYQFDEAYTAINGWYRWLVEMIEKSDRDSFISYHDAIEELEKRDGRDKNEP